MNTVKAVATTFVRSPPVLAGVVAGVGVVALAAVCTARSSTMVDDIILRLFAVWLVKVAYLQPDYCLKIVERCLPPVVFRIPVHEPRAALTIDDVPLLASPTRFEEILDVLRRHGVTATFFIMSGFLLPPEEGGMQAPERERCLELLRRAVEEGHELANHLQFDKPAITMAPGEFDAAFAHCDQLISDIHGQEAWEQRRRHWFRPASALWNRHILATASARGYTTVIANCFPHDVSACTRHVNHLYLQWRVRPGSVVVLHDRWHTPATLDKVLPKIARRGLKLGTLSALQEAADVERERWGEMVPGGAARQLRLASDSAAPAAEIEVPLIHFRRW